MPFQFSGNCVIVQTSRLPYRSYRLAKIDSQSTTSVTGRRRYYYPAASLTKVIIEPRCLSANGYHPCVSTDSTPRIHLPSVFSIRRLRTPGTHGESIFVDLLRFQDTQLLVRKKYYINIMDNFERYMKQPLNFICTVIRYDYYDYRLHAYACV